MIWSTRSRHCTPLASPLILLIESAILSPLRCHAEWLFHGIRGSGFSYHSSWHLLPNVLLLATNPGAGFRRPRELVSWCRGQYYPRRSWRTPAPLWFAWANIAVPACTRIWFFE